MNNHLKMDRPECALVESGIYMASGFYAKADTLRKEFDQAILGQRGEHCLTPLAYAYCENAYQFLTASAERCFCEEAVAEVIEALERWGHDVLGTSHVSTPQIRVYVRGCSRRLLRDDVAAPWHCMLFLTTDEDHKRCRVKVLREGVPETGTLHIGRIVSSVPVFNQLLVHSTHEPYCVDGTPRSMNPLQGLVFLDGYLW
jgi:hypothetical protein